VKPGDDDVLRFAASSFRSVWALELLLILKGDRRSWSHEELVTTMRASDAVVSSALDSLMAAGLASTEGEGALYLPINEEVAAYVDRTEALYTARPDAVRRAIVRASTSGLSAFADAFRWRND
jgi:DNA-binding IclR family transcriptional regulator